MVMKKYSLLLAVFCLVLFACKQSKEEKEQEKKEDSVVNTTIKTDEEKADSVLKHYQKKIEETGEQVPEMPQ